MLQALLTRVLQTSHPVLCRGSLSSPANAVHCGTAHCSDHLSKHCMKRHAGEGLVTLRTSETWDYPSTQTHSNIHPHSQTNLLPHRHSYLHTGSLTYTQHKSIHTLKCSHAISLSHTHTHTADTPPLSNLCNTVFSFDLFQIAYSTTMKSCCRSSLVLASSNVEVLAKGSIDKASVFPASSI